MELLFVVAKIIGSRGKNDSLLFHSKLLVCFKTIPTILCKDRRWCPGEGPMFWSPT